MLTYLWNLFSNNYINLLLLHFFNEIEVNNPRFLNGKWEFANLTEIELWNTFMLYLDFKHDKISFHYC